MAKVVVGNRNFKVRLIGPNRAKASLNHTVAKIAPQASGGVFSYRFPGQVCCRSPTIQVGARVQTAGVAEAGAS